MSQAVEIEVGQVASEGLRYWRAKEALRQAEARLTAQATALATFEARATSVVGWAVAGSTALVAAVVVTTLAPNIRFAAAVAVVLLFVAAIFAALVLRPTRWWSFGQPAQLLASTYGTELEELEAMVGGLAGAIASNETRLAGAGGWLNYSLYAAATAPIASLAGSGVAIKWPWLTLWVP